MSDTISREGAGILMEAILEWMAAQEAAGQPVEPVEEDAVEMAESEA